MPGLLTHGEAEIVRKVLVALGVGIEPDNSSTSWQIFVDKEPDEPGSVITVYDTTGRTGQRVHPTGDRDEEEGVQIRIRSQAYGAGKLKANTIAIKLDTDVYDQIVTIGGTSYNVHSIRRTSKPISTKEPNTKRRLFFINASTSIKEL